ncbi:MAG: hypothetical protein GTO41_24350 [Burkholderiales bacterium]|nr:hypothetical protein [Burkholderiales bacterium]
MKAVARIVDVARESDDVQRADGVGVSFVAMPYFIGPLGFARKLLQVQRALNLAVQDGDAVILRLPAWHISAVIARQLRRKNYPYAVEVCGDPYDHLNYQKSVPGLSSTLRWWFPYLTRKVCARAEAALYVTHGALQQRYPPSQKSVCTAWLLKCRLAARCIFRRAQKILGTLATTQVGLCG